MTKKIVKKTKPKIVKAKRVVRKEKKPSEASESNVLMREVELIRKKLNLYCNEDLDLYLAYDNEDFALIIKRRSVVLSKVINPNSMQPFESNVKEIFYHCFIIEWGDPNSKYDTLGKLIDMNIPVYPIRTPDGVGFALREA